MTRDERGRRGLRAGLALAAAAGLTLLTPLTVSVASPARATARADDTVRIRVDDITPSAPVRSTKARALRIRITLTNTSGDDLKNVRIRAFRGEPIGNQSALDAALADTSPRIDGLEIGTAKPLRVNLGSTPVSTTFSTTTSVQDDRSGLCLCNDQVYPIYLVARTESGAGPVVGSTATYVPSVVDNDTAPTKVSWVWPLIDRPHRLTDETVFTDDDLADSVSSGGRLDRALQTIEDLDGDVPVTLVVDPELLDELEVMATGRYRVQTDAGTGAGTGQQPAKDWLQRFGALLADDPTVQVSLTPYADPDTVSLTEQGLPWATTLPTAMKRRVTAALNGRDLTSDVAWPADGVVSPDALSALATAGASTVVVAASDVTPSREDGIPVDVTRLALSEGSVTGAMTSAAIQRLVAAAVTDDAGSTAALPILTAEIAVRAIQTGSATSHAVLTPPRYVDADPTRAARAIEDTSSSPFSTPIAVGALVDDRPTAVSRVRALPSNAVHLPVGLGRVAAAITAQLPDVNALLRRSPDARALVAGLPRAVQRITSSAWRNDPDTPFGPRRGLTYAGVLTDQVDAVMTGVRIVSPASSSYTLGSDNSSVPITVENKLRYTVEVRVGLQAKDGLPGFSSDADTTQIAPNAKVTVQIPSRLERSGRIPVQAQLSTTTGSTLGSPVDLYVRSTVFGVIGVVITVGAGGVLAAALIVRFVRRMRRLRRKAAAKKAQAPVLARSGESAS